MAAPKKLEEQSYSWTHTITANTFFDAEENFADYKCGQATVITFFNEKGKSFVFEGIVHGKIALKKKRY